MIQNLLIATSNPGKAVEISEQLNTLPFNFCTLNDFLGKNFDKKHDIPENAHTFEGNAITKAIIAGNKFRCLTLADDSGLEVDALNGRPGVYSARYAPTDTEKITKLLNELNEVNSRKRTARFITIIALYNPFIEEVFTFKGTCEGIILESPQGNNGFGYDPIFFYPPLNKSLAEITVEQKNKISHRGQSLKQVKNFLESKY